VTRRRIWSARAAALAAVFGGAVYLSWRGAQLHLLAEPAYVFFSAELVNYLALVAAVVLFWTPHRRKPPPPPPAGGVDIFIPVCGEDVEMVEATLCAALAIKHPHQTTVLNDGRVAGHEHWRDVLPLCDDYGVRCITRRSGARGKAGNLNSALTETRGEFIVVLDADHLARPELCEMLLGYFEDPEVAFVTSRQCFKLDSGDLLGHQEALFYSAIQPVKDRDNAAFSCGNGVAYRRSAIEQLGGFSEWNIVEDLYTSYELHARGWRSAYVGTPVSVGTAPSTAAEMASQRLRWATDSLRIFFWDNPLLKRGLTLRQRLHYLHTTAWYLVAAAHLVFLLSPIASILLGIRLLVPGSETTYGLLLALYLVPVGWMLTSHVGWRAALRTAQVQTFLAPVFALAVPRALFSPPRRHARMRRGGVTRKSSQRQMSWITTFQHAVLALLLLSIGVSLARPGLVSWAVVLWACVLAAALATPGSMLGLQRDATQSLRIAIAAPAIVAAVLVTLTVWAANSVNPVNARSVVPALVHHSTAHTVVPRPRPLTQAAPTTTRVSQPLSTPPKNGIYLGVFNRSVAGPPSHPVDLRRYPGAGLRILHRFQAWWGPDRFLGRKWLDAVAAHGAVPMITWEPWVVRPNGSATATQRRGIVGEIAAGQHDLYLKRWARDARDYGKPLVIRFMHEMNGDWYPWAANGYGNTPSQFRAAWRHVHTIFATAGAKNVSWVFSIDALAAGTPTKRRTLDHFYPGPRYVDWVGLSGFNWSDPRAGGILSYERVFRPTYDIVKGYGKPIMLTEMGTATTDERTAPAWVHDVMTSTPTRFPRVKAIVWYDAAHPQRDFSLGTAALRALRANARHVALRLRPQRVTRKLRTADTTARPRASRPMIFHR
jgi:cellulose synthase (UDP-forming)